jgi:outer membrane protein TolC
MIRSPSSLTVQRASFFSFVSMLALATPVALAVCSGRAVASPAPDDGLRLLPADPVRDGYVEAALKENLALRQRGASVEEAEARLTQAKAGFLPTVAFEARATERYGAVLDLGELVNPVYATLNQRFGTMFPTDVQVALPLKRETKLIATQPLFAPALADRYRLRREETELERRQWDVLAEHVRAEVEGTYYMLGRALSLCGLLDETRALLDENLRVSTLLFSQEKVTEDAVFRAKAELADWEVMRAQAADGADNARRYLNFLAQKPLDAPVPTPPAVPSSPALALDEGTALGRAKGRAELAAVATGQRVAGHALALAEDAYWPTLGAAAEYGFQGDRYDFSWNKDYLLVSLVLRFNLWNGFGDAARVSEARAARTRLGLAQEELQGQIALEVHRALRAAETARQTIEKVGARVDSTRASYDIVARRYAAGAAPPVELLDARTARTRAEMDQVIARYDYAVKLVELERVAALAPRAIP